MQRCVFLWAALLVVLLGLAARPLAAQNPPPPPDTTRVPRDTARTPQDTAVFVVPPEVLPGDTLPGARPDTLPDSAAVRPAPVFPVFPAPAPAGWAQARWVWEREQLLLFHGLSVLDLLRQVPGLTLTRAGVYGRPVGVSSWGLGGGRTRVFLDGYELDPLSAATYDLQRLALVDLDELRLERGLAETRIEIRTFRLDDSRPFSQVEAATGSDDTRLLRGLFSRPIGRRTVLTLGLDLVDTEGLPAREPFSATTGVVRWNYLFAPEAGVQLEYRQTGVDREGELLPEVSGYRDLILRGRARPRPGLAVDGILGRSWRVPDDGDSLGIHLAGDSLGTDFASNQAALRATYERGPGWLEGAARFRFGGRTGFVAPDLDLSLRSTFLPVPLVALHGEARYASSENVGGTEFAGGVRLGTWNGFSLFGTAATGARGLGILQDSTFEVVVPPQEEGGEEMTDSVTVPRFRALESSAAGVRLGAEWAGWGALLGGALVSLDSDLAVPFGFPFDLGITPVDPERLTGIEAYASVPLFFPELRIEGFYFRPTGTVSQPYLPAEQGRLALTFHQLAYEGNREITLRLEGLRRGGAVVPREGDEPVPVFGAVSDAYNRLNLYLQIRVIDVRAFLIWENLLNDRVAADLPGRTFPGQRTLYGVRWHFRN